VEFLPFAAAAVLLVVVVAIVVGRNRRDASLEPTRLGPQWAPPSEDLEEDPAAAAAREEDLRVATQATDLDERTVTTTLEAWWEYLSVLRVRPLPRAYRYRFYDPYDPPVAERGPDGPVPDPTRVARDVSYRSGILEVEAAEVLSAVRQRDGGRRE
jgi:hypothetical protein